MLTFERLEDLLSCHGVERYSGRNMYGRRCLAVRTEEDQTELSLLADLVSGCEEVEEAAALLRGVQADYMGKQRILYWPRVKVPEGVD